MTDKESLDHHPGEQISRDEDTTLTNNSAIFSKTGISVHDSTDGKIADSIETMVRIIFMRMKNSRSCGRMLWMSIFRVPRWSKWLWRKPFVRFLKRMTLVPNHSLSHKETLFYFRATRRSGARCHLGRTRCHSRTRSSQRTSQAATG